MKDKVFIDTNILIYAHSQDDNYKQQLATHLMNDNIDYIILSNQVINELINILIKKYKLSITTIKSIVLEIIRVTDVCYFNTQTQLKALEIQEKYKLQFYDSLIIATALENNCTILYSEDMHHNQIIENKLKIINPFV
jgi:predicted nucleic acid-binding protein